MSCMLQWWAGRCKSSYTLLKGEHTGAIAMESNPTIPTESESDTSFDPPIILLGTDLTSIPIHNAK